MQPQQQQNVAPYQETMPEVLTRYLTNIAYLSQLHPETNQELIGGYVAEVDKWLLKLPQPIQEMFLRGEQIVGLMVALRQPPSPPQPAEEVKEES